ncbi:hypothetical protein T484DRAFT_1801592 [Baffinella frigidus]|nr:hypothetical protein T484DRAFT_1801592 [Cryptophyta sp. CCMP2293]
MSGFNGEKKDDDDDEIAGGGFVHPFKGVDKAHVIQEARIFNDPNVEAQRCTALMTKLLYLLGKGENFTSKAMP